MIGERGVVSDTPNSSDEIGTPGYECIEGWRITEHELGPHEQAESCDESPDVQPTVTVSTDEATALALRLAARHVASDWLEWEDVPWLDEDSFERVVMAMDRAAAYLYAASRNFDDRHDIDSADILSRAEA